MYSSNAIDELAISAEAEIELGRSRQGRRDGARNDDTEVASQPNLVHSGLSHLPNILHVV
jgi:hypothetical protein